MALFVPFNSLCSFVVSPPISIVIPAILLFALMNHLPQKTAPDLTSEAVKIFLTCQKRPVIVIIQFFSIHIIDKADCNAVAISYRQPNLKATIHEKRRCHFPASCMNFFLLSTVVALSSLHSSRI